MQLPARDALIDLEKHRVRLEETIAGLQASIRHWQAWEIEYEGLKEEIQLATEANVQDVNLKELAASYEGKLMTRKEAEEIIGVKAPRSVDQVINILQRRIDYVQQNIISIEKQVTQAQEKSATAAVVSAPEDINEEGLPITDIIEELDDEGNVISSKTLRPGDSGSQLISVLEGAGLSEVLAQPKDGTKVSGQNGSHGKPNRDSAKEDDRKSAQTAKDTQRDTAQTTSNTNVQPKRAKGVTFSEDTKPGPEVAVSATAKRLEEIMSIAHKNSGPSDQEPVLPAEESPEDAALRRQMLDYAMSEVGAVVAELTLEEGSDWSEEGASDCSFSSDDEDEYGRSRKSVVDDDYVQRMKSLQRRMDLQMVNLGPDADDLQASQDDVVPQDSASKSKPTDKAVTFASELAIAQTSKDANPKDTTKTPLPKKAPVGDIVERREHTSKAPTHAQVPRVSRFKSARMADTSTDANQHTQHQNPKSQPPSTRLAFKPVTDPHHQIPTGPPGKPLATTIVEHDVTRDETTHDEPDDCDPQMLYQQAATEYHRVRNAKIQQQGGFLRESEHELVLTDANGKPRKMSRFKAARLGIAVDTDEDV